MKIPWKHILGWGTPIGCIAALFLDYYYSQPPTEDDITLAGYEPDLQSQLTCFNDNGDNVIDESPESVRYVNQDPVQIRATYPTSFDGVRDIETRKPTIAANLQGCFFLVTYMSNNLNDIRANAPLLVSTFNNTQTAMELRFSQTNINSDNGVFSAELVDENGLLLQSLEVIGLTVTATEMPNNQTLSP